MASKHPVPSSGSKPSRMLAAQGGQELETAESRELRGREALTPTRAISVQLHIIQGKLGHISTK